MRAKAFLSAAAPVPSPFCPDAPLPRHLLPRPMQGEARPSLQGTWLKDTTSSDLQAMGRAMDAMRIGGIQARPAEWEGGRQGGRDDPRWSPAVGT